MDFVHRLSTWGSLEKTDINQALRTNHGRKLDELRPCYTDRFDVYIKLNCMESVSRSISLIQGSKLLPAHLRVSEAGDDLYRVEIVLGERIVVGTGGDCFDALIEARRHLESQGVLVCVEGARKDVWPSGMARSMGGGRKAYRMTLGKQALKSDLVDIFAEAQTPSSIADQEAYRRAWFDSLS